jgi:hypothetical protein
MAAILGITLTYKRPHQSIGLFYGLWAESNTSQSKAAILGVTLIYKRPHHSIGLFYGLRSLGQVKHQPFNGSYPLFVLLEK